MYFAYPLEVTPLDFQQDLWHKKSRFTTLPHSIHCVVIHGATLIQHQCVMDGNTGRGPQHTSRFQSARESSTSWL